MRIRAAAAIAGLVFAGCPSPTRNWGRLRTPEMVEQRSGVTADLRAVMAVDEETAWASGTGGTWLRTIDAGRTWSSGPVPGAEQLDFRSLAAFDGRRAIVLSAGSPARMFRTADGGVSWREVYRNDAPGIFFDALRFADESRGYALADPIGGRFVLLETHRLGRNVDRAAGSAGEAGRRSVRGQQLRPGGPGRAPVVRDRGIGGEGLPFRRSRPDVERDGCSRAQRRPLARRVLARLRRRTAGRAGRRRLPGAGRARRVRHHRGRGNHLDAGRAARGVPLVGRIPRWHPARGHGYVRHGLGGDRRLVAAATVRRGLRDTCGTPPGTAPSPSW